jgi:hypothetical protein
MRGTRLVADINASGSSSPHAIRDLDGVALFSANDGIHGSELWRASARED